MDSTNGRYPVNSTGGFNYSLLQNKISKAGKRLEKAFSLINALFEDRCNTCKLHYPHHKDCTSCDDMDYFRQKLKEIY